MVIIKNVAITGAAGSLGGPVLDALVNSGKFNITVLARESSKTTFPPTVKVVHADFNSVESLTKALQGQDAVVSTVGTEGLLGQNLLIDAAVAAGVKRFLPSEFGSDTDNPKAKVLPIFGYKVAVQKHVEEVAAAKPSFTYTLVRNGPFLDWGLRVGFLLNWRSGKDRIFDGGDRVFSATTLPHVGTAVVGVLSNFEETKNKRVYVEEFRTTQNQILGIAKKIAPEKGWEAIPVDLAELKKSLDERLAKGELKHEEMYEYLALPLYGEGYGGTFENLDNELLGVPSNNAETAIEAILKPVLLN